MNDRELLELAAKAAGLNIEYVPAATRNKGSSLTKFEVTAWNGPFIAGTDGEEPWNPLTDDGDALRLALKMGIQIGNPYQYRKALAFIDTGHGVDWEYREHWEDFDEEPYAATRRAIVRAAAEIGKAKEAL